MARIRPKDFELNLARGVVKTGMAMGISPDETSEVFALLDNTDALRLSWSFTGLADTKAIRDAARALGRDKSQLLRRT